VKRKSTLSILRETCRGICVKRLTNRLGAWHKRRYKKGFTLIELLIVIAVIVVLAGLILSTFGYVQKKGARARVETEIAAMSAACESYKADNGIYPRDTTNNTTDTLNARFDSDPSVTPFPNVYQNASRFLYGELSGDRNFNNVIDAAEQANRAYFTFKPQMLDGPKDTNGNLTAVSYIRDPFGNSYGYSTANQADPVTPKGYNPTFDLWSTAGIAPLPTPTPPATQQDLWIKNW
jgi:prepilin-type N-terminal cleavage/methylation domain-containing protein